MDQRATRVLRLATTLLSYRFNSLAFLFCPWCFADGDMENVTSKVESSGSLIQINVKLKLNTVLLRGTMKVQKKLVCRLQSCHIIQENRQLSLKCRILILSSYLFLSYMI